MKARNNKKKTTFTFSITITIIILSLFSLPVQSANPEDDVRGTPPGGQYALEFDGTDAYINIGSFLTNGDNYTIIVDYEFYDTDTYQVVINNYLGRNGITIYPDNTTVFRIKNETDANFEGVDTTTLPHTYYSACMRVNNYSRQLTGFLNDVEKFNISFTGDTGMLGRDWLVGERETYGDLNFNGTIYEIWMYDEWITESEIENKSTNHLFYHYKLDEGSGTTLTDKQLNGDASIENMGYKWVETPIPDYSRIEPIGSDIFPLDVNLNLTVNNNNNETMNVTFFDHSDGSVIGYHNDTANNTYANTTWSGLTADTTYNWYTNITSENGWANQTEVFTFRTNAEPTYSEVSPNGTVETPPDITLSINVSDVNGDLMNLTFYDNSTGDVIGVNKSVSNGTYSCLWTNLSNETNYEWYVTIDDSNYNVTTNDSYGFTTADYPPKVIDVTPDVGVTDVSTSKNVKIVFDKSMNISHTINLTQLTGTSVNYTFQSWSSTNLNNDTAIFSHSKWGNDEVITLKLSNYQSESEIDGSNYTWSFTTEARSLTLSEVVSQFIPLIALVCIVSLILVAITKFTGDDNYDNYD